MKGYVGNITEIAPGFFDLLIKSEMPEAKPGQFLTIHCGEKTISPRPFSIVHQLENRGLRFQKILLKRQGVGTEWLSGRCVNDELRVEGPKGNGFSIPAGLRVLLLAGGMGIAPMIAIASNLIQSNADILYKINLIYGAKNAGELFAIDQLPGPSKLSTFLFTDDGSDGSKGSVTDFLPDFLPDIDQIYACGPKPMLAKLAEILKPHNVPCQVALETMMGCGGNGRCFGCAVPRADGKGYFLLCQDGPVFDIKEVALNELAQS